MVVKPNGKTEHADDSHDDLIFSYLWALYVFYHGEDLVTRFHLMKTEIYTDDHYDETSYNLEEEYGEFNNNIISEAIKSTNNDPAQEMINEQMKVLNSKNSTITLEDLYKRQMKEDEESLNKIKQTKVGRQAVADAYHFPIDNIEKEYNANYVDIGSDISKMFYSDVSPDGSNTSNEDKVITGNLANMFKGLK